MTEKMYHNREFSKQYNPRPRYDWCKRYTEEEIKGLFMLLWRTTQEAIVTTKELIKECLSCNFKKECKDKHRLIKKLDNNE